MENNQPFVKNGKEMVIPLLYKAITKKAQLEYIIGEDNFTKALPPFDYKYILPLSDISSAEDYLEKYFSTPSKKKIRSKIEEIEVGKVEVVKDTKEDLELLFEWNIAHFKKESTFLSKPHRKNIFRELVNDSSYLNIYTFYLDQKKVLVCLVILYNGIYMALNSGMSPDAPKNLKTYYNFHKIQLALSAGAHTYDAQSSDCGWKEAWHFQKTPQYKFTYPEDNHLLGE